MPTPPAEAFWRPVAGPIPAASALHPRWVEAAYYLDCYRAPLTAPSSGVVDLFWAIFGHHPQWMKQALAARNRCVRLLGLTVPPEADDFDAQRQGRYQVGDLIGRWPIYHLNEQELVAGRDNRHLDFRVSIFRAMEGSRASVAVSTVCVVHNWLGKTYLFFVIPFHRFGVQYIIARALRAGRL